MADVSRAEFDNSASARDFIELAKQPRLKFGRRQTPQQLLPVLKNPQLRRVSGLFGSDRKNTEFSQLREAYGKADLNRWEPFEYH